MECHAFLFYLKRFLISKILHSHALTLCLLVVECPCIALAFLGLIAEILQSSYWAGQLIVQYRPAIAWRKQNKTDKTEENTEEQEESESIFIKCCRLLVLCPLGCCVLCLNECSGGGLTNNDSTTKSILRCLLPCWCSKNHYDGDEQTYCDCSK